MKPGNRIVLLRPDHLQSGPSNEWILQFVNNLERVSDRYNASVDDIRVLTPKDKDARQLLRTCDVMLVILHQSFFSDSAYSKFIENEITEIGEAESKLILISTSPGNQEALNGKLKKFRSFSFYGSRAHEGASDFIHETEPAYWSILLDLVLDLGQTRDSGASIIYLAQTEIDINSSRDIIRRELVEHGYRVVPDIDLISHQKDMKSFIQINVDQSRLAIHLLGNHYGDIVKDESRSISELQVRYIGEYLETVEKDKTLSSQSRINRLIWIDPEFNPSDKRQGDFVEDLKRNIEKLYRTEIIQNPLELFKSLVIKRLKEEDHLAAGNGEDGQAGRKQVYIIHHNSDEQDAGKLASRISAEGISISMLDYSGSNKNLLQEHKRNLRICDASVIYYGVRNRPWLQSKIMDLLKAPGYGRTKPLELRQLLATGEDTLDDISIPREIILERATDPGKALLSLIKHLKQ